MITAVTWTNVICNYLKKKSVGHVNLRATCQLL